jgi:hypothetical protein
VVPEVLGLRPLSIGVDASDDSFSGGSPTDVTGASPGIITHWREVAAPHGCHFENYLVSS